MERIRCIAVSIVETKHPLVGPLRRLN